jgi:hypothetical protein
MSGLNTTYPIKAGSVRGALHGAADTDWHTLTSADFKDSVSGSAFAHQHEHLGGHLPEAQSGGRHRRRDHQRDRHRALICLY